MTSLKELPSSIKLPTSESNIPNEDISLSTNDVQQVQPSAPPQLSKKKSNPLQLSSSKFTAKSFQQSQPFFPESANTTFDSTDVTHSSINTEPIFGFSILPIIEHLDLNTFKTKPCPLNTQHNHKHCPFYHNAKDRKRMGFYYSADLCEYAEKDSIICPNGDVCPKAHNRVEQLYRPEKYKTKFCTYYPNNLDKCEYGNFCSFAHSENDIAIDLVHNYEYDEDFYMFHFKTIWCPFNLTQHDKALCVYAHNWQDYRRKPNVHSYEPTPCPNWKSTDFILNYEDGCPFKEKCNKCHGWKEHEYHPLNYKVKPCPAGKNCQKGRDCPHFHHTRERRIVNPNIMNRVFRYVPRNRIITNTFKVRAEDRNYQIMAAQQQQQQQQQQQSFLTSFPNSPFKGGYNYEPDSFMDAHANLSDFTPKSGYIASLTESAFKPMNESMPKMDTSIEKGRRSSYETVPYLPEEPKAQPEHIVAASMIDLKDNNTSNYQEKRPRKWSSHEEPGFGVENDRLFREIIFSPPMKEKGKKSGVPFVPEQKHHEDETEPGKVIRGIWQTGLGFGEEVNSNLMLDKILENEDI